MSAGPVDTDRAHLAGAPLPVPPGITPGPPSAPRGRSPGPILGADTAAVVARLGAQR